MNMPYFPYNRADINGRALYKLVSAPDPLTAAADGLHHRYAKEGPEEHGRMRLEIKSIITTVCLCITFCLINRFRTLHRYFCPDYAPNNCILSILHMPIHIFLTEVRG